MSSKHLVLAVCLAVAAGQLHAQSGKKSAGNVTSDLPACSTMPASVDEFACNCPNNPNRGSVWGNDPYTADSDICTAGVHSGYIDEEGGDVVVLRVKGLSTYTSGESFGVTTSDWGPYGDSITFDWNR